MRARKNADEYAIIAAGSLLGIALHEGTSFPVGKVGFVIQRKNRVLPLEVKAEENLQAKSLRALYILRTYLENV